MVLNQTLKILAWASWCLPLQTKPGIFVFICKSLAIFLLFAKQIFPQKTQCIASQAATELWNKSVSKGFIFGTLNAIIMCGKECRTLKKLSEHNRILQNATFQ